MATAPPLPKSFEDAIRVRREVEAELERVCVSPHFKTSRRSCEFLRYVVQVALDGREDSLKERTIGMELLCRDSSYDPSSDATVRVRANDVRKRLASFYGSSPSLAGIRIVLSAGTYVPSFLPVTTQPDETLLTEVVSQDSASREPSRMRWIPGLAAIAMAVLVCLTLFLTTRHRVEPTDGYLRFWDHILTGKKVLLLSVSDQDRSRLAPGLFPVVWIAGKFGVPAVLTGGSLTGATTTTFAKIRISTMSPTEWASSSSLRWILDAHGTPTLLDRSIHGTRSPQSIDHASLLTIQSDSPSIVYVQTTDEDALRKMFEILTSSTDFPGTLLPGTSSAPRLQILLRVDPAGRSSVDVWKPSR